MATNLKTLVVRIAGDTSSVEASFAKTDSLLKGLGNRMSSVGKSLTFGLSAPLAAIGGFAGLAADSIDNALDSIRVGTGATGKALDGLGADFRAVFADTPATAENAAKAISDLNTRLGVTGPLLQKLAAQELELARLGGTDLGETIRDTTRLFGDWSIVTGRQAEALDFLWKTAQTTGVAADRLAAEAVDAGASLRQFGFGFEESVALLGKWEKEGVSAERIMSSLRIGLTNLAAAGKDAPKALQDLMTKIRQAKTDAQGIDLARAVFGSRAAADFSAAVREGRFEVGALLDTLRQSPETIEKASRETRSFGENMQLLKNRVTLALQPLGVGLLDAFDKMQPLLRGTVDLVGQLARAFGNLSPSGQTTVLAFGAVAVALGPVLTGLAKFIELIRVARTTMLAFAGAQGLAALGTLLNPAGAILIGAGALASIFLLVKNRLDAAAESARQAGAAFKGLNANQTLSAALDTDQELRYAEAARETMRLRAAEERARSGHLNPFTNTIVGGTVSPETQTELDRLDVKIATLRERLRGLRDQYLEFGKTLEGTPTPAAPRSANLPFNDLLASAAALREAADLGIARAKDFETLIAVQQRLTAAFEDGNTAIADRNRLFKELKEIGRILPTIGTLAPDLAGGGFRTATFANVTPGGPVPKTPVILSHETAHAPSPAPASGDGFGRMFDGIGAKIGRMFDGIGAKIGSALGGIGRQFLSLFNPLGIAASMLTGAFQQAGASSKAMQQAIGKISAAVAQALKPILDALAPVFEKLAPVIAELGQIFGALVQAVSPILEAIVPLLQSLMPIVKAVAIGLTYVAQVAFMLAGGILIVLGFVEKGLGEFIHAIAKFVDTIIPFADPLKSLEKAGKTMAGVGQGMIDLGHGFLEAAGQMDEARDKIRGANGAISDFGDALDAATASVRNVPSWLKLNLIRFQSVEGITPSLPPVPAPPALPPTPPPAPGPPGDRGDDPNGGDGERVVNQTFHVTINGTKMNPRELWEAIKTEVRRDSLQKKGTTVFAFRSLV